MAYRKIVPVLLVVLLCAGVSVLSASATGAHSLQEATESVLIGGSSCSDLMDGIVVGMGVGVIFGCVWCGIGAVAAKAIGLFC